MKNLWLILAFVGTTLYAQDSKVRDEIRTLQARYDQAIEQKDSIFLGQLFHPAMIITGGDGTRRDARAELRDCVDPRYHVVYFKTKDIDVDVVDDTAILRGDIEWELKQGSQVITLQRRITFTYVRVKKRWVILAQHIGLSPK